MKEKKEGDKMCEKLFFLCFFVCFSVQVVVAQEAFILTDAEMDELENLLVNLKSENEQLMTKSEGLMSLAERLKIALEKRTESLNALRNSYDEFESETKKVMREMSSEIVRQEVMIKGLKKKVFTLTSLLVIISLALVTYIFFKVQHKGLLKNYLTFFFKGLRYC